VALSASPSLERIPIRYVMISSENKMTIPVGLGQMIIGDVCPGE
jgi:hypothetical protein